MGSKYSARDKTIRAIIGAEVEGYAVGFQACHEAEVAR